MGTEKNFRSLDEMAAFYGFENRGTSKKGHVKYVHSSGSIVFASATNSDPRAMRNIEAEFKRGSGK